ncbi:hypothetical protein M378DRAFT_854083 [Amanita muscaria Koide BX008]|uniref:Uncharacterized protein n=1 Tax=Amanita muscaria (strain Koide BX008) TaxID=946122 RepID=A0A0C2SES7_AMAMK|nr:hypothetical protein M378DRAFT_854083 [Amanita muscaria Koide BX008]
MCLSAHVVAYCLGSGYALVYKYRFYLQSFKAKDAGNILGPCQKRGCEVRNCGTPTWNALNASLFARFRFMSFKRIASSETTTTRASIILVGMFTRLMVTSHVSFSSRKMEP